MQNRDDEQKSVESTTAESGPEVTGNEKGGKSGFRFSIGKKLYLAFAGAAGLTVIATAVAWISFGGIGTALQRVTNESAPAMQSALQVAAESATIAATASALAVAETQAEREEKMQSLRAEMDSLNTRLDSLSAVFTDAELLAEIQDTTVKFGENLLALDETTKARIDLDIERTNSLEKISNIEVQVAAAIAPIARQVEFGLVKSVQNIAALNDTEKVEEAKMSFLMKDRRYVGTLIDLQTNISTAVNLVRGVVLLDSRNAIATAEGEFVSMATSLLLSLANLPEHENTVELNEQLNQMTLLADKDDNIFRRQAQRLTVLEKSRKIVDENRDMVAQLSAAVDRLVDTARAEMDLSATAANTSISGSKLLLAIISVTGLIGALLIGWLFVGRNLVARLRALGDSMVAVAGGDLDAKIPSGGNDELSDMAAALLIFRDTTAEIEHTRMEAETNRRKALETRRAEMLKLASDFESSVKGVVEIVSSSASEMKTTASSMVSTAESTNKESLRVAAASEQATTNVQTVATAAEELSASIAEISRQVTKSSEISQTAVADAERTNASVRGLSEAANRIGEVVDLIHEIADQTNLLALNATIEAARAGDAGKGFAVVASEVKSLADQTAKATDEIAAQIGAIQSATRDSVGAIEGIGKTISEISEIAGAIAAAVEEQGAATQEIARNVQQAAQGTQEVSISIGDVTEETGRTGKAANDMLDASGNLEAQSSKLTSQVDAFLAQVRSA